jgi:hypothetical protein
LDRLLKALFSEEPEKWRKITKKELEKGGVFEAFVYSLR